MEIKEEFDVYLSPGSSLQDIENQVLDIAMETIYSQLRDCIQIKYMKSYDIFAKRYRVSINVFSDEALNRIIEAKAKELIADVLKGERSLII